MDEKAPWTLRARVTWEGEDSVLNYLQQTTDLWDFFYSESAQIYFNLSEAVAPLDFAEATQQALAELQQVNGLIQSKKLPGRFQFAVIERNEVGRAPTQILTMRGIEGTELGIPTIRALDSNGQPIAPHRTPVMSIARLNPRLAFMLRMLADVRDNDWGSLYKIVEIFQKRESTLIKKWGLESTLETIRSVANNPVATGDHCRHVIVKGDPAAARIEFREAKEQLSALVNRWIAHLDQQNP